MNDQTSPQRRWRIAARQPRTWRAEVFLLALVCAVITTAADTYLLDRKLGVFSGGYLAEYRIVGVQRLVFAVVSILSDVAVMAPIIAGVLWLSLRVRMHAVARAFLSTAAALGVLGVADVAVYELHRYVGDLINADVLVNLLRGDIREILYFTIDPALHWLGFVSLGALVVIGSSLLLDRWFPTTMRQDPGARRSTFVALLVAGAAALAVGTAARLQDPGVDRAMRYKPTGRVLGTATQWLTDVDRDGYGLLSAPADPAPFDASIHPFALEVAGNGVDENGVGGDLPAGPSYQEAEFPPVTFASRPDVVFVILESFRADAVGATVGGRPVTPTLDRLARLGVAATHAYSHNGFTVQSRYHAFTGHLRGPARPGSLVDDFNANGYETAFFSAQDESFGEDFDVGFERARVRYDARVDRDRRFTQFATPASLTVSWKVLEGRVEAFLDRRSPGTPLFLHLNVQDGHYPYVNPDVVPILGRVRLDRSQLRADRADDLRAMYLNTLSNVDAALGRILAKVEQTTGRTPAVVVIADHGESLFDEGFLGHGYAANDAQTRIPFIVSHLPAIVPDPVAQIDVRRIVREAMARDQRTAPVLVPDPARRVFQYIGTLEAPKEIAYAGLTGRLRVNLMKPERGAAQRPEALTLVRFWERLYAGEGGTPH